MARLLLVLTALVAVVASAKLPPSFKTCKRNDPKFNECLKGAVQDAIPSLVSGIQSLGVLPVDPLEISELHIGQGDGPVQISLDFHDIQLAGLGSGIVKSASLDAKNYKINADVQIVQPVVVTGPYKIDGKVLILPIKGEGNCNLTFTELKASLVIHGEPLSKDGKTYMNVKQFDLLIDPSHLYIQLENLFNGDKALGDNMNVFLNENWKEILEELKPAVGQALGESFKQISNRVFQKIPFDEVFPEK